MTPSTDEGYGAGESIVIDDFILTLSDDGDYPSGFSPVMFSTDDEDTDAVENCRISEESAEEGGGAIAGDVASLSDVPSSFDSSPEGDGKSSGGTSGPVSSSAPADVNIGESMRILRRSFRLSADCTSSDTNQSALISSRMPVPVRTGEI